jgi:sensor histidine kinase YesM
MSSTYKRSVLLINRRFQLRFSFYVCSWLFGLSIMYPMLIYNLYDFFFRYLAVDPNGPELAVLESTRNQMMILLVLLQVFFLGITFFISLFISHRIAGPLYKLKQYMKRAGEGKMEALHFRERDYFKELEEGFNEMIVSLKAQRSDPSTAAMVHLQKALDKLPASDTEVRQELQSALKTLQNSS